MALALVGIRKVGGGIDRFWKWLRPRPPPTQHIGGAEGLISRTGFARGKAPGLEGWTDEQWHAELDRRIDQLTEEFDHHDHPKLDQAISDLRAEAERIRSGFDDRLADFDAATKRGQTWERAGLVVAFFGAVLQGLAIL